MINICLSDYIYISTLKTCEGLSLPSDRHSFLMKHILCCLTLPVQACIAHTSSPNHLEENYNTLYIHWQIFHCLFLFLSISCFAFAT